MQQLSQPESLCIEFLLGSSLLGTARMPKLINGKHQIQGKVTMQMRIYHPGVISYDSNGCFDQSLIAGL